MARGKVEESRKELIERLEKGDLHLHYYASPDVWMTVENETERCGTLRCFKLRIKNFHPDEAGSIL